MNFDFSVLLSVYYKEKPCFLAASLDSIFSQSLRSKEIVLVKDGILTPELEQIISQYQSTYPELKVIPLSQNRGLGEALNEGLKHCSYELVARMDTDDIAKPHRFEKQIEIFRNNPYLNVVGAWIDEFEGTITNVISARKLPEHHEDIISFAKSRCPINHPVVMFKKQSVIDAGGYIHFPLFEDYYLWVRMLLNGAKFYNIQESLLFFRSSPDVYMRRGGFKYAVNEFRLQKKIRQLKFITQYVFLKNISIRFIIRVIPNKLRTLFYKKLLRRNS